MQQLASCIAVTVATYILLYYKIVLTRVTKLSVIICILAIKTAVLNSYDPSYLQ